MLEELHTSLLSIKIPNRSDSEGLRPALILLHGRGTDEHDLAGLASFFDPRFLIYSLRAPFRFPFGGYMWFGADDLHQWNDDELQQSHALCTRFIDQLPDTEPVDPKNIFLFGFSMGATMALELIAHENNGVRGVVAHSGFYHLHGKLSAQFSVSSPAVFLLHGTYDTVVPVEFGRETLTMLQSFHAPVRFKEYPIEHAISEESLHDSSVWLRDLLDSNERARTR